VSDRVPTASVETPGSVPSTLRGAVVLLYAEALGLALLAAVEIYDVITTNVTQPQWAVTLAAILVLLTVLFGGLGFLLSRRRGGARNPAVALHLLALPVGYYLIQAGRVGFGVCAFALCLAGVALLVAPPTTKALGLR
jgi:hypothetical protein